MRPTALVPVVLALICLCATGCRTIGGNCGSSCGSCPTNCRGTTCDPCGGLSRTRLAQGGHLGQGFRSGDSCNECRGGLLGNGGLLAAFRGRALGGDGMCGCGLRGRLGLSCGRCGLPFRGPTEGTPYTEPFAGPAGPMAPTVGYPYYTTRAPRDFLLDNPPSIGR
ncbi:MAG: hypothetical protein KDA83_04600 [Planctomycetales bacterium]|nr:hypothetical protein [Planctomycetales bacterium]